MFTFENIFNRVLQSENDKSSSKYPYSKILLFTTYFTPNILKPSNAYSWDKYIKYKFFILNSLLHYKYIYINDCDRIEMMYFFSTVQKHMMALYRFKNICMFKTKKYLAQQQDLQFNLLSETLPKYTIDIIQGGIKHQFSIFDLIRIINTSLSYEYNFFTDPKEIKNPWNNIPFTKTNLYNIYLFIDNISKTTSIRMPILFSRFFQSNFCLQHFEDHNQLIIKKYIIENCHTNSKVKKLSHIYNMIEIFNSKRVNNRINIDNGFPENRLLEVMEPYLKFYLLANYSYDEDILIKQKKILNNKLRLFHTNNPFFGRKIITLQLRKLYYVSCLYYNENRPMFLPGNIYIPPPSLISLTDRCYYIDKTIDAIFTPLPDFENYNNNNNKNKLTMNIAGILPIIRSHVFTMEDLKIINDKYCNHIHTPYIESFDNVDTNFVDEYNEETTLDNTLTIDANDFNQLNQLVDMLNIEQLQNNNEELDDDDDDDDGTEYEEFVDDDSV